MSEQSTDGTERSRARAFGYKPIREYREIRCVICGGEMDPEELDDPGAMVSDPAAVHWGCMP